jgi:uncharacterized protein YegL
MKKGLSEIVAIIDRSGSMCSIKNDSIGGFNSFLNDQKKVPGEATFTLILFDHEYIVMHNNVPIKKVSELTNTTYVPRGLTALHDAIGRTIVTVGERLHNTSEEQRPEKVIVAILTDGEENESKEYSLEKIKEMITHQKNTYGWEFIFLAANQDAFKTGAKMGIDAKDSICFAATGRGITEAYEKMSIGTTSYRA